MKFVAIKTVDQHFLLQRTAGPYIGAVANVGIATLLFTERHPFWRVAGIAGAATSAVWNFAVSSALRRE